MRLNINGILVNARQIEIAEFNAETKTLTVIMNGVAGKKEFTGDQAAEASARLIEHGEFKSINGKLVNPDFVELAEFDQKTGTLTLTMNGCGHQQFTGDEAAKLYIVNAVDPEPAQDPAPAAKDGE